MGRWNFLIAICFLLLSCQPDETGPNEEIAPDITETPNQGPPGNPGDNGPGNGQNNNGPNNNDPGNSPGFTALPEEVNSPADNPSSLAKIELGRALFWDPVLSGNMDVACATCHHPNHGYADGIPTSIGVGGVGLAGNRRDGARIDRNAPTILNTAFNGITLNGNYQPENSPMFWDIRTAGLEDQALEPIHSLIEMRGPNFSEAEIVPEILRRLTANGWYRVQFADAFGSNAITQENMGKAIAAFERTLIANNSRYDQYIKGDEGALNAQEIRGMNTFERVGCLDCHSGPMFSDYELHVLGVREGNNPSPDRGAGNFEFRTPTLRNLNLTAPYMHNGALGTLEDVLRFYDQDNNNSQNSHVPNNRLDTDLRNLENINPRERADIIAFLKTLEDNDFDRNIPTEVPSGLPVGGDIGN